MENTLTQTVSYWLSLFYTILYWDIRFQDFFSFFHLSFQPLLNFVFTKCKAWTSIQTQNSEQLNQQCCCNVHDKRRDEELTKEDIRMVLDRLGIGYDLHGETLDQEIFGAEEFSELFEEEPSMEEVKEAFDVFDQKKDGYIDAAELQRVLCSLGLNKDGYIDTAVEECRKMIQAFDMDGDGKIDFSEFVKLMEKCFC